MALQHLVTFTHDTYKRYTTPIGSIKINKHPFEDQKLPLNQCTNSQSCSLTKKFVKHIINGDVHLFTESNKHNMQFHKKQIKKKKN